MKKAQKNLRSSLNLFFDDGFASCAHVYPFRTNDKSGMYYDEFANDQDWAMYFADKWLEDRK